MTMNVTNITPEPGLPIPLGGSYSIDVTWSPKESKRDVLILLGYGSAGTETAWDGSGFLFPYAGQSVREDLPDGYRFTFRRTSAWPAPPVLTVRELGTSEPIPTDYSQAPLVLDWPRRITYDGPVAAILALAATGHSDTGETLIDFPVGSATSLRVSPDMNIQGDYAIDPDTYLVTDWNAAVPNVLALFRVGGVTLGTLRAAKVPDVSAPTVISAIVDSLNPDALRVKFSSPVSLQGLLTGLTLPFVSGTVRTITGIEAGDGTDTVTFTLSGTMAGTESCSFAVGSTRVVCDYSGNKVVVGSTAVTFAFGLKSRAAFTHVFERDQAMLPASGLPAALTSWTDQVGGSVQVVQTAGGASASRTTAGLAFTNDATQRCKATMPLTAGADFAIYTRVKFAAVAFQDWVPIAFDEDGAASVWVYLIMIDNGSDTTVQCSIYDGTEAVIGGSYPSDALEHDYFIWRAGGTLHFQRDAVEVTPVANTKNVTSITTMGLGNLVYAGPTSYKPGTGTVVHAANKAGAGFVGTEIADIRAYAAAL